MPVNACHRLLKPVIACHRPSPLHPTPPSKQPIESCRNHHRGNNHQREAPPRSLHTVNQVHNLVEITAQNAGHAEDQLDHNNGHDTRQGHMDDRLEAGSAVNTGCFL